MRHPFDRPARLLPLALGLALAGCASALGACDNMQRSAASRATLMEPVLVVNAEEVSYSEFNEEFQTFLGHWDRFIQNDAEKRQELRELVLERLIEEKLLDQEARRHGIELPPDALQAQVHQAIAPYDDSYLEQAAEVNRVDEAAWSRAYLRRLVHERLIRQEVLERIRITDQEIADYYAAHPEEFQLPEQVRVRHLAVGSRRTYNRVRRLLAQDADFEELIAEYSTTPDRQFGGDLGFVERGVLPPEFDEAIFSMTRVKKFNNLNQPVQTQIGFHIFRLEGRKEARRQPLSEAAPLIRERLIEEKQAAAYRIWLEQLRERATIVINRDLLHTETG